MMIQEDTCDDSMCSSSSSAVNPDDITIMGDEDIDAAKKNSTSDDLKLQRNIVLAIVAGMGAMLSAVAYICWSSAFFTAGLAGCFSLLLILVYSFSRQAEVLIAGRIPSVNKDSFANKSILTKKATAYSPRLCLTERTSFGADDSTSRPTSASPGKQETLHDFLGTMQQESFLLSSSSRAVIHRNKPIADLFLNTSVLFADIEGFTAWSSVREPQSVFMLLETLYHAFDTLATRRKVFKVETVGDCYVAVTGLPEPRKDHAVVMARFARDCLKRMRPLCKKLEIQLGPDTGDLNIRIGIHSGSVTGGVLRGERARFQLFGDTVNTAARIETTGQGGQIHLSSDTANLLKQAGKSQWVSMRPTKVIAKGKGAMQTYWLNPTSSHGSEAQSFTSGSSCNNDSDHDDHDRDLTGVNPQRVPKTSPFRIDSSKMDRLVSWNVDILHRLLKQIVARRQCLLNADPNRKTDANESIFSTRQGTLLDEVQESIPLPSFNYSRTAAEQAENIQLDAAVFEQLQDYVGKVADMYNDNPFHNFEHASHVTMSVTKLLGRIVAPSANDFDISVAESGQALHDHTYGITSDPLTQFSCVLSALIHDADHPGVPNSQLVEEQSPDAEKYKNKSIAEQNSVDQCWNMLMKPRYSALRKTIYTTNAGLCRFRSLVVNSVLATDICDPDLKQLRNNRWDKAFNKNGKGSPAESSDCEDTKATNDRKATIVIEHLIQASDVAHTFQHWHIYRKWNERLFKECYKAYKEGRAAKNPCDYWYEGEIGFYDFYVIPLAKKLKECGVFGVSSSEYLDYAMRNREEWEAHGKQAVEEMIANLKKQEWNL